MDPIKAQKLRAMNLYRKSDPFFRSLILHSLIALACSLFCSYSYSFPNSFYTIKHLVFNSLPNTWSWFLNPSCLFVVVNFIVVFLIGESRLSGKQSSPAAEIYDEYVARAQSLRRRPSTTFQEIKKEERIVVEMDDPNDENANGIEDHKQVDEVLLKEENDGHDEDFEECEEIGIENERDEEEEEKEKEKGKEEELEHEQEQEQEQEQEEEEEAVGMPAEELNKRIEDFIARVNKQRWLEARFLVNL